MAAFRPKVLVPVLLLVAALAPAAQAALTISPITWNIIGLDSNDVNTGPNNFPVGARVCSNVATTNVTVDFHWDSANPLINLRGGSLDPIIIPNIAAGTCQDAYFEVTVTRNPAAFDTARGYHITATDFSGTVSTPTPRELYVERLISQSRNSITDVKFGTTVLNAVSIPAGGDMNMVVGNTYVVQLYGGTATQGYEQFEEFINFPNTIFQILDVDTTYSADTSPFVPNPNDKLYADACGWENDPNSPNYRSCVGGAFKVGGNNVVTTYTIRIVGGGGTSQTLTSLLHDFSGSSFHYNADYETSARVANIIDPTTATISKSFFPNPAPVNGVSTLTFTLANPNPGTLGGYNFVDNLPANLVVATPPNATTSGCGAPTLTANAGSSSISFSGGTVAANGTCVITVNVTPTATGTLNNTTNNLFIDAINTGDNAAASLTVNNEPPPGTGFCGTQAQWTFPAGFNVASPAPTTANVTASAKPGDGITSTSFTEGANSWGSNGDITTGASLVFANEEYVEFAVNTSTFVSATFSFAAARKNTPNSPRGIAVYAGSTSLTTDGTEGNGSASDPGTVVLAANATALPTGTTAFTSFGPIAFTPVNGTTYIRIYFFNSGNVAGGFDAFVDNVTVTGCVAAIKPTLTKSFSPDPIAVNGVSTLTFTLTNTNTTALTGAAFMDGLPAGVQVAATPSAATTCGGTWAPTAGATSLTFSGGTIPASGSCTVSVDVTATTAGPHSNVGGFLSTTESGTTTTSVPADTLTALLPPSIEKAFDPSPVLPNGTSTLTFTITNPNVSNALAGVAFSDSLPSSPAQMQVAPAPAASATGCGAPTFAPAPGATSLSFSGATIAPNGTCVVTVDVVVPAVGTYNNTSGNVSAIINGSPVNGNTASDSLEAVPPQPSISLLKQVGPSPTGPWTSFLAVSGGPVFYQFTVENTGDVPLSPISVTDDTLDVSACNAGFASTTLPPPVPANENHIVTCVVGPVPSMPGSHTNTAHATGVFAGNPVNSPDSSATYATTGLTLDKTSVQSTFNAAGNTINYNYLVTNSGFAPLPGPVTVADDKTTVTCPAVTTVGDLDNFLDPGESVTCTASYIVTPADVAAAFVTNTATATVAGVESNSDSTTVVLSTAADVSITKTLNTAGPYTAGQSITYTLAVSNAGPATATNVQVTDTPTNLSITSVSGSGCAALPCTIPSLLSGASTNITVNATINAPGAFDNVANVSATQPDPNPANNVDNTGNNGITGPSADVSVVKTLVTGPPYFHQDTITYTLFVANAGPSTATNVQVTDAPTNLTIQTVSSTNCSSLPCTIPSLAAGADETITVTATIDTPGPFDNSATVDADEPDPDPADNTDNTGNGGNAMPLADVSIDKVLSTPPPFSVGQTITYTITVTNAGPSLANNIDVTDTPSNLTIQTVSSASCSAFPCTIPLLAPNNSEIITVTATIDNPGIFNNSANAMADEPDPNVSNNTDNTDNDGNAGAQADTSIVKNLDTAGPFIVGQTIQYTLQIHNAGPQPATNVNVVDSPSNLSITGVSGDCASLPCTIPNIPPLGNASITVMATIDEPGSFDNVASVSSDETDPDPTDNTDDTNNGGEATDTADVSVTKSLDLNGPFHAGQSISFTIQVSNAGPSTATNIQVSDSPTNLNITGVSGDCNSLPCTIPSLAPLGTATINVTATIVAAGDFDNSVTVDADQDDPDPTDNTANDGDTAVEAADVSVTKTLTATGPFYAGSTVTFDIVVTNGGPNTATNIQVTDTPTNLTITSVQSTNCSSLPCTIPSLPGSSFENIAIIATINAAGPFDNAVTVDADQFDPDDSDNSDNDGGEATSQADVSITKTLDTPASYNVGQSVTYTIVVANAGPSTATNIQVTDTPTNLTITNVSGDCTSLPCTIASLASGDDDTITVTATINSVGDFDNSASANADEPDPDSSNNTDNAGGTTGPAADVRVEKSIVTAGPYHQGDTVTFQTVVTNDGPDTATNVVVTDTPIGVPLVAGSISGGGCTAFPCTIPSILSGAGVTITYSGVIQNPGAFDNSATVSATEFDPDTSNNSDLFGNGGVAQNTVDVAITKTLNTPGPYAPGQTITYTLVVSNTGPGVALFVVVSDTPTNLTITSVSGAGCTSFPCTLVPGVTPTPASNRTITVTATINAVGPFDNSATATPRNTDYDPNLNNNTANAGGVAASADVSVTKTLTSGGPFQAGDTVNYLIRVFNDGPSVATNIQVTDTPTNLTITSVSDGCNALPCTLSSLNPTNQQDILVTATINSAGDFDNSVTVAAAEPDPDPSDNTDNAGGTTGPVAEISVVKSIVTPGPYHQGDTVAFQTVVTNNGPATATNVVVTDTPIGVTLVAGSISGGGCTAFPCTIPSISNGASVTITYSGTINNPGAFDNSTTVDATEFDPNTANNSDLFGNGGVAQNTVDVAITKTLNTPGPYTPGQTITYTLVVSNAGPGVALFVVVTDTPTNLTITNVSGAGCTAFPCTLIPGVTPTPLSNRTITVTATIDAVGPFDNSATATPRSSDYDPNLANNTDNTGNNGVAASADVSVVKTLVTAGPYTAGQSITYTLDVANAGPSTATTVQVTDTPTNLTITNVSGGGCAALPCTIASLASGASVTITVTATINASGAFDNAATVSATEPDPDPSDNTDNTGNGSATGLVADVSVVKTLVTAPPYTPGQSVTYTLDVANAGPLTATNVQVTDTPTNLTITNVSGGGCAALPCTIASLASGASVTITVTATINAAGAFDNAATVSATEPDPDPSDNTDDTGNGGVAASADVSIVKTLVTAPPYTAGQSVTYTLDVANAGPSTATSIQVTDTPTNLTITNVSGGGCAALPCTIASLPASVSVTVTVTATINAPGTFDNAATVSATEPDPDPSDNTDDTGNGSVTDSSADVSIVKTLDTAGPYVVGQSVTYTLDVANAGPSTATNIQVTDTPTNLTITGVSGACAALPCTILSLPSGSSVSITVTATIDAEGTFDNAATVSATEPDPDPSNNTDDDSNGGTAVAPTAVDLALLKTAASQGVIVGQPFDFTLLLTNNGPGTATNVVVTDPLPTGFSLISATSTQGTCSGTTTVTCTIGTMLAEASVTITIRGTPTGPGELENTATASAAEAETVTANNTATAVVIAQAAGIPTVSEWGLILLAMLLALAAVKVLRP